MPGGDHGRDEPATGCPVCGRPFGPEAQCPECGWILRSSLRTGRVTPELREEFALRLHEVQHALDTRIAARVFSDPLPYKDYIRGGAPDAAEWAAARREARRDADEAADSETLRARLTELVSGLTADATATVTEVSEAGITTSRTGVDRAGTPWLKSPPCTAWTSLLPMLSATEAERHFQLAGGLSQLDRGAIAERLHNNLPDVPDDEVLVICRPAGWLIPEWAAGLLAERPGARLLRAADPANGKPVADLLASLTTEAPLRESYQLMVATVDEAGKVKTEAQQIFASGDTPGTESRLPLHRPPGDGEDIVLAIFSASASATADGEPLGLYALPPPPGREFELRTILGGPGRMQIIAPPGATAHPRTWAQVRSEIPDQVDVAAGTADLVCAVDLAGPTQAVRARLRLVRSLLERLTDQYPEPGRLRVSVLTCTDHDFERGRARFPVVSGTQLSPVPDALAWFARQSQAEMLNRSAAPIEDLLHEASIMLADSHAAGRAPRLLLVGARRPHPFPRGMESVQECPLHYKWQKSLERLTGSGRSRCVAVVDAASNDPATPIWEQLGPAGLRRLPSATAQLVGEDLGLLVSHAQRIPIPLPNTE